MDRLIVEDRITDFLIRDRNAPYTSKGYWSILYINKGGAWIITPHPSHVKRQEEIQKEVGKWYV